MCDQAASVGIVGDGETPNDAAYAAWRAGGGKALDLGVGTYLFESQISANLGAGNDCVAIVGCARNLARLYFPNAGGGLKITGSNPNNSFSLRNFTVETGQPNGGVGIEVDGASMTSIEQVWAIPKSEIENVSVVGSDLDATKTSTSNYWSTCIKINPWSNVDIKSPFTAGAVAGSGPGTGIGIQIGGTSSTTYATLINILCWNAAYHAKHLDLLDFWQGIVANTINANGGLVGTNAVCVEPGAQGDLALLQIVNSQLNCGGDQVYVASPVYSFLAALNNVAISTPSRAAFSLPASCDLSLINHNIMFGQAAGQLGLYGAPRDGTGEGNVLANLSLGWYLIASSANFNASQNTYKNVTTKVANSGAGNSIGVATD